METINAYYAERGTIAMSLFLASSVVIACCGMATPDKQVSTLDFEGVIFWTAIAVFLGIAFPQLFSESMDAKVLQYKARHGIVH